MARKYRFTLGIGYHRYVKEYEYDDEDLEGMTEDEIEKMVEGDHNEWCSMYLDGGFVRIDGKEAK